MSTHTPGPWEQINNIYGTSRLAIMHETGIIVAEITDWPDTAIADANARLIAAAPDLLDALGRLLHMAEEGSMPGPNTLAQARAAIAKAKGDQP